MVAKLSIGLNMRIWNGMYYERSEDTHVYTCTCEPLSLIRTPLDHSEVSSFQRWLSIQMWHL